MSKLSVYNFITLNGCFKGPGGDISWHKHGNPDEAEFAAGNLQAGNMLLFGRITYEMMAGYWPTPFAMEHDPIIAEGMNRADKIVFSRTLEKAAWSNTSIVKDNIVEEIKKLKKTSGRGMTLLGSGSILTQFAEEGLIDEYQIMVDPVIISAGTPIFNGLTHMLDLELTMTRTFKSGAVLLCYRPAGH